MNSTIVLEDGKSKQIKNIVIVISDSSVEKKFNIENVYCYDFSGKELWQIEDLNLIHEKYDYTGLYFQESDLYLYNRCGVEVKINPESGKVLSTELIK